MTCSDHAANGLSPVVLALGTRPSSSSTILEDDQVVCCCIPSLFDLRPTPFLRSSAVPGQACVHFFRGLRLSPPCAPGSLLSSRSSSSLPHPTTDGCHGSAPPMIAVRADTQLSRVAASTVAAAENGRRSTMAARPLAQLPRRLAIRHPPITRLAPSTVPLTSARIYSSRLESVHVRSRTSPP